MPVHTNKWDQAAALKSVTGSCSSVHTRLSSVYLFILSNSRYFPSKYRREIKRLNGELEQLLKESIQRSREIADEGRTPSSACGMGLLGMLLAETEKNRNRTKSSNGELGLGYDAETMIDECKTFFFAGHETSALLLTWAIMLLATNPSWQDKARAEVASVCGDAPPTADHLPKLTVVSKANDSDPAVHASHWPVVTYGFVHASCRW